MKKLLSLSILAATLASTVAFAVPGNTRDNGQGNNSTAAKMVILASERASAPTIQMLKIAQTLVNNLDGSSNYLKAVAIELDPHGGFDAGHLVFAEKLSQTNVDAVQAAFLSAVRTANQNLGWTQCVAEAGNRNTSVTLTCISSEQNNDNVKAFAAVKQANNGIDIVNVKADQAIAKQLESAKNGAHLKAVALIAKS